MPGLLVLLTVGALLVVLVGGALYYRDQKRDLRRAAEEEIATIAHLKADEIATWRADRSLDGHRMSSSPSIGLFVNRVLEDPEPEHVESLRRLLVSLRFGDRYRDVMLVDEEGRVLVRAAGDDDAAPLDPVTLEGLATVFDEGETVVVDVRRRSDQATDTCVYLDVIAPIFRDSERQEEPVAAIVLRAHAEDFLFPLVGSWPTPSETAETLLVRRDGDEVRYLTPLRHMDDPPLTLTVPIELTDVTGVMAVLGEEGLVEGFDYRGRPVLSYLAPIPDSPWYMIAEVDTSEAFADLEARTRLIVGLVLALVASVIAIAAFAQRRMWAAEYGSALALERAERRAQERLVTTMRSIGDAVISCGAGCRIEFMNPVAEELTGWSLAEAVGMSLGEVFRISNEDTGEIVESPVDVVLRDEVVVGLANHTLLLSRDGTERPIADSAAPIHDETGAVSGVVLVFRDQTEERAAKKALARSAARFRSLVEGAPDAIFVQVDGRFAYVNRATCRLLGVESPDELVGEDVLAYVHPAHRLLAMQRMRALNEDKAPQAVKESVFVRADGEEVAIETSGMPIVYEGRDGALVFVRDVSERKAAERELERYRGHLEELVEERTRELAEANAALAEADRAKSAFLASVSHELRTPLNSIIGFSGILAQGMAGELTEEQQGQVEMIRQSGRHLLALINDVLDLSKIEAGVVGVDLERFDPVEVVDDVVGTLSPLAAEKELELDVTRPERTSPITSDPGKLKQILLNLAGNAVKFTDEGRVGIRFGRTSDDSFEFVVEDTGPGIPEDVVDEVFDAFVQIEQTGPEAKPEGTGLGLAISKEYAQMLGGDITVESETGVGSTFTLRLPTDGEGA